MFKSLAKAVVGVVTLPIDAVADLVTLGGVMNNKDSTYTGEKMENIMENIDKATDSDDKD